MLWVALGEPVMNTTDPYYAYSKAERMMIGKFLD